jgi:serpin B
MQSLVSCARLFATTLAFAWIVLVGAPMTVAAAVAGRPTAARTTAVAGTSPIAQAASSPVSTLAKADNQLALELLRQRSQGNLVLSPLSIATALGMVDAGARGTTALQIQHVLHVSSQNALESGLAALLAEVQSPPPSGSNPEEAPQLNIANGLWLAQSLAVQPAFLQTLHSDFGAQPQSADFQNAPEAARAAINEWISARTQQLIPELFGPGTIRPQTRLVLADAIYLKALWQSEFKSSDTGPAPFTIAGGKQMSTPFMRESTQLPYAQGRHYRAVELPYRSSELSMLALMPTGQSLAAFQRGLSPRSLQRIVSSMHATSVELRMPRFHVSEKLELGPILSKLGMPVAFSEAADFSGISPSQQLSISNVVHSADLKVEEKGTIAAAATGITVETTALARTVHLVELTLDHPFLFFLRDDRSGAILFAGRLAEPTESAAG